MSEDKVTPIEQIDQKLNTKRKRSAPKATMGRPNIFNDEKFRVLKELCRLNPSLRDACVILDISETTLAKHILDRTGQTFSEFREDQMAITRTQLIKFAISRAGSGGDRILIFLLKNFCGLTDVKKIEHSVDKSSVEDYLKKIREQTEVLGNKERNLTYQNRFLDAEQIKQKEVMSDTIDTAKGCEAIEIQSKKNI